jgi:hypothetical protein
MQLAAEGTCQALNAIATGFTHPLLAIKIKADLRLAQALKGQAGLNCPACLDPTTLDRDGGGDAVIASRQKIPNQLDKSYRAQSRLWPEALVGAAMRLPE